MSSTDQLSVINELGGSLNRPWFLDTVRKLRMSGYTSGFLGGSLIKGYYDKYSDIEVSVLFEIEGNVSSLVNIFGPAIGIGKSISGSTYHFLGPLGRVIDVRPIHVSLVETITKQFSCVENISNASQDLLFNVKNGHCLFGWRRLWQLQGNINFTDNHRNAILAKIQGSISDLAIEKHYRRKDMISLADTLIFLAKLLICVVFAGDMSLFRGYKCIERYISGRDGLIIQTLQSVLASFSSPSDSVIKAVVSGVKQIAVMTPDAVSRDLRFVAENTL